MTKPELYTDAMLTCDVPEHRLRRGDIVKLVEQHIGVDAVCQPDTKFERLPICIIKSLLLWTFSRFQLKLGHGSPGFRGRTGQNSRWCGAICEHALEHRLVGRRQTESNPRPAIVGKVVPRLLASALHLHSPAG
jgi:hypothetical protein